MLLLKKYKWALFVLMVLLVINIFKPSIGMKANQMTVSNFINMFSVLPPIMLLIGLLDVWVPKEVMIRFMGEKSGVVGIGIAFLLGALAAGPLYSAFPIASILLKKHAKISHVLFFLGVWSTAKLPLVMFEYASFGGLFTLIHISSNLAVFLVGAYLTEKWMSEDHKNLIYKLSSDLMTV